MAAAATCAAASAPDRVGYQQAASLRRELIQEMNAIDEQIQRFGGPSRDHLTQSIAQWKETFMAAIRREESAPEETYKEMLPSLVTLLHDDVPCDKGYDSFASSFPLDEETYLGSDGHVYGGTSLTLISHQRGVSQSPITHESPFTVRPHSPARYMTHWLKNQIGRFSLPEELERKLYGWKQEAELIETMCSQTVGNGRPSIPLAPEESDPLRESAERRKLQAELREMEDQLGLEEDALSTSLRRWRMDFLKELRENRDMAPVCDRYTTRLQEILGDVDENAYLDPHSGRCYGHVELSLYLAEHSSSFTVRAHQGARSAVKWLQKQGKSAGPSEEMKSRYERLDPKPSIPFPQTSRRQRLIEIQRKRKQKAQRAYERAKKEMEPDLNPLREKMDRAKERFQERVRTQQEKRRKQMDGLKEEIGKISEEIDALKESINQAEKEASANKEQGMSVEKETDKLNARVKEVEKKHKERYWKALALGVAGVALTFCIPGGSVFATQGGGLCVKFVILL